MEYCERCERSFGSWDAYDRHVTYSSRHNVCAKCEEDYLTSRGLEEHLVRDHFQCNLCDCGFNCDQDLDSHFGVAHLICRPCDMEFTSVKKLREHWSRSNKHNYCWSCDRHFQSESHLDSHLKSSAHQSKDCDCPARCDNAFVSRAAVVLHLEAGSCPSGVNRATVDMYVYQYDTKNIFTDRQLTINENSAQKRVRQYGTTHAWNGSRFECELCGGTYRTLAGLKHHLESPRHEELLYQCPDTECEYQCSAFSALVQHFDSEKCEGMRIKVARRTMDTLLRRMDRLEAMV